MVKEIALRKESGEVETFGVDWSNPHEMAADSAKSSGPGRNRVDPRIINMTDSKGQIILKGLLVSSNSPKIMNERIRFYYYDEFVRSFFQRIRGNQKSF